MAQEETGQTDTGVWPRPRFLGLATWGGTGMRLMCVNVAIKCIMTGNQVGGEKRVSPLSGLFSVRIRRAGAFAENSLFGKALAVPAAVVTCLLEGDLK